MSLQRYLATCILPKADGFLNAEHYLPLHVKVVCTFNLTSTRTLIHPIRVARYVAKEIWHQTDKVWVGVTISDASLDC